MQSSQKENVSKLIESLTQVSILSETISKAEIASGDFEKDVVDQLNSLNGSANKHIGLMTIQLAKINQQSSE